MALTKSYVACLHDITPVIVYELSLPSISKQKALEEDVAILSKNSKSFTSCKSAVVMEVSSPELPTLLQQEIVAQLHHKWQETRLQPGQLTLNAGAFMV